MNPEDAPMAVRIIAMIVHNKARTERMMPAVAKPFFGDFRPRMPKIKPASPNKPEHGHTMALGHRLTIPNTSEAMLNPDLSLAGTLSTGGNDSTDMITS
jgi:hypothetical protein